MLPGPQPSSKRICKAGSNDESYRRHALFLKQLLDQRFPPHRMNPQGLDVVAWTLRCPVLHGHVMCPRCARLSNTINLGPDARIQQGLVGFHDLHQRIAFKRPGSRSSYRGSSSVGMVATNHRPVGPDDLTPGGPDLETEHGMGIGRFTHPRPPMLGIGPNHRHPGMRRAGSRDL